MIRADRIVKRYFVWRFPGACKISGRFAYNAPVSAFSNGGRRGRDAGESEDRDWRTEALV